MTVVPTFAVPAALAVDPAGNGVLEPGELATLRPAWTNTSGASLHLTGATSNFTGPAGAVYVNPDDDGDYGTIADQASAECTDCYSIQIEAASRPAPHWDASIDETVNPSSIARTWALHVGESFPDVPTSHPFYAFIETLFHDGVTGGCGAGDYCPDERRHASPDVCLPTQEPTRVGLCAALMLVHSLSRRALPRRTLRRLGQSARVGGHHRRLWRRTLLPLRTHPPRTDGRFPAEGEHGGSYAPPPCVETVFFDVPCPGGPFVDWINQLAAEGVTGGCGGGLYCPGDSVSRGEMAVFLVKTFGLPLYGL